MTWRLARLAGRLLSARAIVNKNIADRRGPLAKDGRRDCQPIWTNSQDKFKRNSRSPQSLSDGLPPCFTHITVMWRVNVQLAEASMGKARLLVVVLVVSAYGCAHVKAQGAARSAQVLHMLVRG